MAAYIAAITGQNSISSGSGVTSGIGSIGSTGSISGVGGTLTNLLVCNCP